MASLKAIYLTTDRLDCGQRYRVNLGSTTQSLASLRDEHAPSVAHYANCVKARLACHLQGDLILQCERGGDVDIPRHIEALDVLCVLDDLGGAASLDLQRELMLWF